MDFAFEMPEIEIPQMEMSEIEIAEGIFEIVDGDPNFEDMSRREVRKLNRQAPLQKIKVKDYMCCSMIIVTFFNFMGLGTAALWCSQKARNMKIRRDVAGAKRFGCWALTANIFAIIGTIACTITVVVFYNHRQCTITCLSA